jgi:hypothetical protein
MRWRVEVAGEHGTPLEFQVAHSMADVRAVVSEIEAVLVAFPLVGARRTLPQAGVDPHETLDA